VLAAIVGHLDYLMRRRLQDAPPAVHRAGRGRVGYLVEFIPADSIELATKHLVDGMIEVGLTEEEMLGSRTCRRSPSW